MAYSEENEVRFITANHAGPGCLDRDGQVKDGSPLFAAGTALTSRETLTLRGGNYKVDQLLGKGTFSDVVACQYSRAGDTQVDRLAVKVFSATPYQEDDAARFNREVSLLVDIAQDDPQHKLAMVRAIDTWSEQVGNVVHQCIAMPKYGATLLSLYGSRADLGREGTPMPRELLASVLEQLLHALVYLHDKGRVHCDVKLENVLCLTDSFRLRKLPEGSSRRFPAEGVKIPDPAVVVLCDFNSDPRETTQMYHSPEIILQLSPADSRYDMWCLGMMGVELACGIDLIFGDTCDVHALHLLTLENMVGERLPLSMLLQHRNNQKSVQGGNTEPDEHGQPMQHVQYGFFTEKDPAEVREVLTNLDESLLLQSEDEIKMRRLVQYSLCEGGFVRWMLGRDKLVCDFLISLLRMDPAARLTAQQALETPLMQQVRGRVAGRKRHRHRHPSPGSPLTSPSPKRRPALAAD